MVLGEKEFEKTILDELVQNLANIENWRRNHDQKLEHWSLIEENVVEQLNLEYLGDFQWFWVVLEEMKQKERALNT